MVAGAAGEVVEVMREPLRRLAMLVEELWTPNPCALTAFGAVVDGPFDPARELANTVLVTERTDLDRLRKLAEAGPGLARQGLDAPLIMTQAYIRASLDTFPLELIEIQQRRVTLLGGDAFAALTFEDRHVRHECERELKSILVALRQGLLAAGGDEAFLSDMEVEVAERLLRTLRGLIWLRGQRDALPAHAVLEQTEAAVGARLPGVRLAVDHEADRGWNEFTQFYRDVERLAEAANAW